MMIDIGLAPAFLRDYLRVNGHYIDVAKIFVGSARLYDEAVFRENSEIYREHGIGMFWADSFLGMFFTAKACPPCTDILPGPHVLTLPPSKVPQHSPSFSTRNVFPLTK